MMCLVNTLIPERLFSNQDKSTFVFKSVRHWRLQNERDVLIRFQSRTRHIRQLVDEIEEPPALILKYMDDDVLHASNTKTLTRPEVKFVAKGVLEALDVLHRDSFVHTGMYRPLQPNTVSVLLDRTVAQAQHADIKPSNILVNYGHEQHGRFKDVRVADFGSTISQDSSHAISGDPIGTPMFRSPEAHIQMKWGTSTDIWSFGATVGAPKLVA